MTSGSPATVLITGAAGFLGSHLCEQFLAREWRVVAVDNLLTGVAANLDQLIGDQPVICKRGDGAVGSVAHHVDAGPCARELLTDGLP